jgi:hypothetical protein
VPLLLGVQQKKHAIIPNRVIAEPMTAAFWPVVGAGNFCMEWSLKERTHLTIDAVANEVN